MPKTTVSGQTGGTNHAKGADGNAIYRKQYVRCTLSDADKARLKAAKLTSAQLMKIFQDFVDAGHKVSMQFEAENDCYGVYATQNDQTHGNYPFCLTARGPDIEKALAVLLYKHTEMLAGDWASGQVVRSDADGWG